MKKAKDDINKIINNEENIEHPDADKMIAEVSSTSAEALDDIKLKKLVPSVMIERLDLSQHNLSLSSSPQVTVGIIIIFLLKFWLNNFNL